MTETQHFSVETTPMYAFSKKKKKNIASTKYFVSIYAFFY